MLTYRFGLKKTRNWDKNTNKFSLKIEDPKRQNEKKLGKNISGWPKLKGLRCLLPKQKKKVQRKIYLD